MNIEEFLASLRSAPVRALLRNTVRPVLRPGARALVYPLALSARIGHLGPEPHYLLTLFGGSYDQLVILTPPRGTPGTNQALYDLLSERFTMVETEHEILLRLSLANDGVVSEQGFDLLSVLPTRLYRDYALKRQADGARFYGLGDRLREQGARWFERLGLDPGTPFVLLHVRDAGHVPEETYRAHGEIRSASAVNFRPSVEWLLGSGYAVFRIGGPDDPPLAVDHPLAFDLPFLPDRADWMDVFLCGACRFSVNCQSGPEGLVRGLGGRSLNTNLVPTIFGHHLDHDLFLYKPVKRGPEGPPLTYPEMVDRALPLQMTPMQLPDTDFYRQNNLVVRENSAGALLAAVKEMAGLSKAGTERPDSPMNGRFIAQSRRLQDLMGADPGCRSRYFDVYPHSYGWGKLAEAQTLDVAGFV